MKNDREREIVKTSVVGIVANVFLVAFKAFVGFLAGSVAIIMDAVNNLTDALSSVITIVGTKLAGKRPDKKHPYGYGRIEYLTSTLIAALILFAGGMAIYESIGSIVEHFREGAMPSFEIYSIVIVAAAIAVKVGIGLFFRRKGGAIDSDALKASGTDALFDSVLSTATLVGVLVAKFAGVYLEGYLGILIGAFILKSGVGVMKEALSSMIGERFDKEYVAALKADINAVEGVRGCYDLILNGYGHDRNVGSVHVTVSDDLTARQIQTIERNIALMAYEKYHTIMTVGVYAENLSDENSRRIFDTVSASVKRHAYVLQIHGFYADEATRTISFDLVISFDDPTPLETIRLIREEVAAANEGYAVYVQYDQDFSLSE